MGSALKPNLSAKRRLSRLPLFRFLELRKRRRALARQARRLEKLENLVGRGRAPGA